MLGAKKGMKIVKVLSAAMLRPSESVEPGHGGQGGRCAHHYERNAHGDFVAPALSHESIEDESDDLEGQPRSSVSGGRGRGTKRKRKRTCPTAGRTNETKISSRFW